MSRRTPFKHSIALLLVLLVVGLAVRLPILDEPLFEGAAGKQAHTAMIARNMFRGRSGVMRPIIDDVGQPGYFVKDFPVVPLLAASVYRITGAVDEKVGRIIGMTSWLLGLTIFWALLGRSSIRFKSVAGAWFVLAPLGIVYSRAFMNDASAVTMSLATLAAAMTWRKQQTAHWAIGTSICLSLSMLLKPHSVFLLGPALGVLFLAQADGPGRLRWSTILAVGLISVPIPAAWYTHAARLHALFPVNGATVIEGWFDPTLLLDRRVYFEIGRQLWEMVFTPIGVPLALSAVLPLAHGGTPFDRAMLAWGLGTLVQCLVFNTRMLDVHSRGSEYYQLAMVPLSAMLVAHGTHRFSSAARRLGGRPMRFAACGVLGALLLWGIAHGTLQALTPPPRYSTLIQQCAFIIATTAPTDEFVFLADRGGVVAYYCDRKGMTFAVDPSMAAARQVDRQAQANAFARARYVFVPFPDLIEGSTTLRSLLMRDWVRVPSDPDVYLYEKVSSKNRLRSP